MPAAQSAASDEGNLQSRALFVPLYFGECRLPRLRISARTLLGIYIPARHKLYQSLES
jgi:hypothetical protein